MSKKIFIIAGEASGDLLGSKLIRELKIQDSNLEFIGVGGKLMQEEGLKTIFPMEELSVMGILEVLPHIPKLLKLINYTAKKITEEKPQIIITIDSPDFNFRVMKKLQKNHEIKKVHLIAPSVWAYREGRAKKISKLYDLLLAILPFEPPYFEKYGLKTVFIGHPIVEKVPDFSKKEQLNLEFRKKYQIQNDEILVCVTPGSRNSEVKKIFPEFIGAINLIKGSDPFSSKRGLTPLGGVPVRVVIPLVAKTKNLVEKLAKNLQVKYFFIEDKEKESAFFASNFALAKSGTNTVELSLYQIPMIVAYKINFITHFIIKLIVKIKFANLINLISNQQIIPEMLQDNCCKEKLAKLLEKLILDKNFALKQIEDSKFALNLMGLQSLEKSSAKAAKEILNDK